MVDIKIHKPRYNITCLLSMLYLQVTKGLICLCEDNIFKIFFRDELCEDFEVLLANEGLVGELGDLILNITGLV